MRNKSVLTNKIFGITIWALTLLVINNSVKMTNVMAGAGDDIIDASSFVESLDESKWNAPNADIEVKEGKLLFGKDSTRETRLITKRVCKKNDYHKELFHVEYEMNIKKISAGEQFFVGFGVDSIESYYDEPGNMLLTISNDRGLKVGLSSVDEDGKMVAFIKGKSIGSMGSRVHLSATADVNNQLVIKVNGSTIYNQKSPVELTGRVGLFQTGGCEVEIENLKIVFHRYDTPENTNVTEDFESGTMNVNALQSRMYSSCLYYPAGILVEEYEGSKVLMFRNAGNGYLGSEYQYSNFEMTFDIPYMLNKSILDENKEVLRPKTDGMIITFGGDVLDRMVNDAYKTTPGAILLERDKVSNMKGNQETYWFSTNDSLELKENQGYSVKITVIDTQVTVSIKRLGEKQYAEALSYKVGNFTPTGYIHIWTRNYGNFAIDNLRIINKDQNANLVELDYKEGFVKDVQDWEYESAEAPYLEESEDVKGEPIHWSHVLFAGEIIIGIIVVLVCLVITRRRKIASRIGKGENRHEK